MKLFEKIICFCVGVCAMAYAGGNSSVTYFGVWEQGENHYRTSAPAAGFSFYVTFQKDGGSITAELEGDNFFEIFVDGNDVGFIQTSERRSYTIASKLSAGRHLVEVFHRSESMPGEAIVYGVSVSKSGSMEADTKRFNNNRRIAFIGDSYTVGYGVEANGPEDGTPFEQTNSTKSYAFLLSRKLMADFRIFAFSGRGLVRNYAGIVPEWPIPRLLEYTVPGMAAEGKGGAKYDTSWHPQVIVIFVGINDFQGEGPHPSEAEFAKEYHKLLAKLREEHRGVKFLLVSTKVWPESLLIPAVKRVYDEEIAAGNEDVSIREVATENTALHGHPNKYSQDALSKELLPIVGHLGKMLHR